MVLFWMKGRKNIEIAKRLGVSEAAIGQIKKRAILRLEKVFETM